MAEIKTRIILRNDTAKNWSDEDAKLTEGLVLYKGEIGVEFDPSAESLNKQTRIKIGDGITRWSELPYIEQDLSNYYNKDEIDSLYNGINESIDSLYSELDDIHPQLETIGTQINSLKTKDEQLNDRLLEVENSLGLSSPTVVPTSGYIGKLYFNTNLSAEEVNSIGHSIYNKYDTELILFCENETEVHFSCDNYNRLHFYVDLYGEDGSYSRINVYREETGWQEDILSRDGFIEINQVSLAQDKYGNPVGVHNEQLVSIVSITPFGAVSTIYNKTEVDALLAEKANASDVYTKTEVDNAISNATIESLDADKVTFADNLIITRDFGKYIVDESVGSLTIPTADEKMTLKGLLLSAFSEETNPEKTDPAVSFNSVAQGSKEVGTEVTLSYTASLSAGSYTYGPETGIIAKSWEVSVANIEGAEKLTSSSSNFGKVTVKDGDSAKYKITAKATHDAGAMPVTNLGNDCPSQQIAAGSKSKTSDGLTGYRAWFHCYRPGGSLIDVDSINSDTIRNNIGSDTKTKWVSKNGSFTSSFATTNMQQIFFAAPAGVVKAVSVAHSVNGAPQTVLTKTIYVKGAGNYVTSDAPNGMAYDLFYVSNDNPNDGAATYTITVTK